MNRRRAPGRIPGRPAIGFATLLVGLVAASTLSAAPAPAAIVGIGLGDPMVEASPGAGFFSAQRIGSRSAPQTFTIHNTGPLPVSVGDVTLEAQQSPYGDDAASGRTAFSGASDCAGSILLPDAACQVAVTFAPQRPGSNLAILRVVHDGDSGGFAQTLQGEGTIGLYEAGAFGEVLTFGDAKTYGDLSHVAIETPVLGIAATPSGQGYWLMEASGRMHRFGDAPDLGSPTLPPDEYAIAPATTPTGQGYWLATQVGGVRALGDAEFFGSAAGTLGPDVDIIGLTASPSAKGYWLLDSAGGVHAFGDAGFFGSAASLPPRYPIMGMAATASGKGYWLIDALGGIFAYGDAEAYQPDTTYSAYSLESALQDAVVAIETLPYGQGFVYGRMRGTVVAKGAALNIPNPYSTYSYSSSGSGFQTGSVAVDLAFNVPPLRPSPESGTVVRTAEPGLRFPKAACALAPCTAPPAPAPPEAPAPPAPAPPAVLPLPVRH